MLIQTLIDSTSEHFTTNTRDLTLKRQYRLNLESNQPITIRGLTNKYGYAYCGPTMNTLNRFVITLHMIVSGGRVTSTYRGYIR